MTKNHKPWAAVFADGTSSETYGTYTLYRGYFAGQVQKFEKTHYNALTAEKVFGNVDGS